jgi:hypothetical protein
LRFYGLGRRFTLRGLEDLLAQVLSDEEVQRLCATWIYDQSTPELFARLLYNIGFLGLTRNDVTTFRSTGPQDTTPPAVSASRHMIIHPSYWDSLDLQDKLVNQLDETRPYLRVGLVPELPGALTLSDYVDRLLELEERLTNLGRSRGDADEFEEIVGDIIRYCFHRVLTNVEARVRNEDGTVIRDWIASNRADTGFWRMVRERYGATQVVWECKNYTHLKADDFHQVAYYMTPQAGRFGIIAFRGASAHQYDRHAKRIAQTNDGLVLVLTEQDLKVFIRQARNGQVKDAHIQDRFDRLVRALS